MYAYVFNTSDQVDIWGLIILYHAGNLYGNINLKKGRLNLDFNPSGKGGFYTTTDLSQAQEWAKSKGYKKIAVFDIPDEKLATLKIKTFDAKTDEWTDFVTKGRAGTLSHDFDAVSGPYFKKKKNGEIRALGNQFAIFSDKAAKLFDEHKIDTIDYH